MRTEGLRSSRGATYAAILTAAALLVGWLCFRAAIVRATPPATAARIAPDASDVVLARATDALVARRGQLDAATLDAVRRAAAAAPLDARPFLILGHQQLLEGRPEQALRTLEAGQRLNPRQRLIHVLLLDRYLRTGRYAEAGAQFSALARLVGTTQGPIAEAMAAMSQNPETRDAVRRTLSTDAALERSVLGAMARSTVSPRAIFDLASPRAERDAGLPDSWGPALVDRLVKAGRFAEARMIWRRIFAITDSGATYIYDAGLRGLPGSAPFNWTLAAGGIGAAEIRGEAMTIEYYGRDSGELAGQTLTLTPGAYRFRFAAEGSGKADGTNLFWSLRCLTANPAAEIARVPVRAGGAPRRTEAALTVPRNCAAQRLALTGEAAEFPTPASLTLRGLSLTPAGAAR